MTVIKKAGKTITVFSLVVLILLQCVPVLAAGYPELDGYTDIDQQQWYSPYVAAVVKSGIMQGVSTDKFGASDEVTLAQAITMAARLHRLYYTGKDDLKRAGDVWYSAYLEYALKNRLISVRYSDYSASINRGLFAQILAAAYPEEALPEINKVEYIPDMSTTSAHYAAVLRLYRAGVCTGNASNQYEPGKNISRVEAAAVVTRMLETALRTRVTLKKVRAVSFFIDEPSVEVGKTITLYAYSDIGSSDFSFSCEDPDAKITSRTPGSVTLTGIKLGTCAVMVRDETGGVDTCTLYVHRKSPPGKDLSELISQGSMEVSVRILSIQEAALTLKNNTKSNIDFFMPSGSYLSPTDRTYQRMLLTTLGSGTLMAGASATVKVGIACMDFDLKLPNSTVDYTLKFGSGSLVSLLAEYFTDNHTSFAVRQAAVWIAKDDVTYAECGTLISTAYTQGGELTRTRTISQEDYDSAAALVASLLS